MEFRLTYKGRLRANGDTTEKQQLRRDFHPQLRILWDQIPLKECHDLLNPSPSSGSISIIRPVGPFRFAPLVAEAIHLVCELEITFLRPEPPGSVVTQGGDIDNRLKTLFDALRTPKVAELPVGDSPKDNETPFFCLLEDDNLITKVTVSTDRLLCDAGANDVMLVMHVTTKATKLIWKNMGLG